MKKRNYVINFLLILLLTVAALWFALRDNFNEVMELLSNMKWYAFLAILLYGFGYVMVIGKIYQILGRKNKMNYRFRDGLNVAFVGMFFSGVTPSATGGQFGQAYIMKNQGIKISDGASILWIDFIIYQGVMVAYTSILMLLRFNYYYTEQSNFFILVLIGYLVNSAVIVVLFAMAAFPKGFAKLCDIAVKLLSKTRFVKEPDKMVVAWNAQVSSFTEEIKKIKTMKKMIFQCILLNTIRFTLLYSLPYFIAFMMGLPVKSNMLFDIIVMSAFVYVSNAFFPVPGASGGTEAAFMLIFSTMFDRISTNSIMILWRFASYHIIILVGGFVFVLLKHRFDKNKTSLIEREDYLDE